MKQKDIMLTSEANAMFARNHAKLGAVDPVCSILAQMRVMPTSALEVGCSNGWRLLKLRKLYGCEVMGVEPSRDAAMQAAANGVPVHIATASSLPLNPGGFDLVIYGFCLYLTDPADWLKIVAEGDQMLRPGGYLVIHDFYAPGSARSRLYEHCDGVLSYHFDFASLWVSHPLYSVQRRELSSNGEEAVTVLKKLPVSAIPVMP